MKPQEIAFWTALYNEQSPANYLVFADWCEDNEKPDMAETLRWAQKEGRFTWVSWYHIDNYPDFSQLPYYLMKSIGEISTEKYAKLRKSCIDLFEDSRVFDVAMAFYRLNWGRNVKS